MNILDIPNDILFYNICYRNYEVGKVFGMVCKTFNRLSKGYNGEKRNIKDYFLKYMEIEMDGYIEKYWIHKGTLLREGKCECWYNIQIIEILWYKNGRKNGRSISWYRNGNIKMRRNYKDGELEGEYIQWDEDGNIKMKGNYKNGKLEGYYIQLHESGLIIYI
ncbi:MORN-repeat protein [Orpheovirus IHUMI-LCC2]|uniref:MORN-repeat protein n=1 Tax=Orpheovirus IHUMI-LCC2 TaxID=2023057 RepID=A0A2I2L4M1_9VIRU|nr:MORN-repeat protein [Orpheovirus IHUMI-LCC2]SNW62505.1 MORN-repeat protein [Orpheovirus IHUMI-LCC2]